ncbi:MAG: 50S ribosomal protein L5 [Nitrospinota bacterium]|nr:50S ribosomal protein L5 [Nitrospinota bacterium]
MSNNPRLLDRYREQIVSELKSKFDYKNIMEVPTLSKITLNMGLGEASQNATVLDKGVEELTAISGQKPVVTKAKKSVANFKLREGTPIGAMVTLRRKNMWYFFDRLLSIALPRVRDFRGLNERSFDGRGNYSIGIREQVIFPEISVDSVDKTRGLGVVIETTAKSDEEGKALLECMGFPFRTR